MEPGVVIPTQTFKRNILLILYGEGKRNLTLVVCFRLLLKREREKNVWHLQPISSIWRPLAFLPEKEMATHSSILAWRIPGTEEPGGLLSMGLHRVRHDWSDLAALVFKLDSWFPGVGNGYPLQYSLPGEFHDLKSLVGYSPWGCKELDMTKRLTLSFFLHFGLR